MGPQTRRQSDCDERDIIRIPMTSGDALRVLGVCAACGAFRDVTGLAASAVYEAIHETLEEADKKREPGQCTA